MLTTWLILAQIEFGLYFLLRPDPIAEEGIGSQSEENAFQKAAKNVRWEMNPQSDPAPAYYQGYNQQNDKQGNPPRPPFNQQGAKQGQSQKQSHAAARVTGREGIPIGDSQMLNSWSCSPDRVFQQQVASQSQNFSSNHEQGGHALFNQPENNGDDD